MSSRSGAPPAKPCEAEELRSLCGPTLRPGGLALTREALELGRFPPGARLLDLGCGPGGTLRLLRESGYEAQGLDKSPEFLAEAGLYGPVLEADFHDLPLDDEFFDGVFCECVLSLSPDPARVLGECARVLKRGGLLVVSDLFSRQSGGRPGPEPGTLAFFRAQLAAAGFSPRQSLDRSRCLKELAARLVWRSGSAEILARLRGPAGARPGPGTSYYLLIAEKTGEA
ncbi:MAG: class I SAM-dependent methyltransferase [Candidatus Adiutrix sp.]|nr:class I SAM-dependent methyltransferase [Candidatus Adiutrix sp.]